MNLSTLNALKSERIGITKQLQPLNALSAAKRSQLSALNSDLAGADARLDAAIQHAAHVQGRALIGDATPEEVDAAVKARQAAVTAHAATQIASTGVRALGAELDGLQAAGHELGVRLGQIDREEAAAQEAYLRGIVEDMGADYANACAVVASKFAAMLAGQQMLAAANLNPNVTVGSTPMLLLPSFNTSSANSPVGVLVDYDRAHAQQPEQFRALLARIAADGIAIAGLT